MAVVEGDFPQAESPKLVEIRATVLKAEDGQISLWAKLSAGGRILEYQDVISPAAFRSEKLVLQFLNEMAEHLFPALIDKAANAGMFSSLTEKEV